MKFTAFGLLLALSSVAVAQTSGDRAQDETAIRAIFASLSAAWTNADAQSWGNQFTDDADFTAWMGAYVKGRETVTREHKKLFETLYKDTKQRIEVRSVRFFASDVAVVHADASVVKKEEEFPAAAQTVPVAVLTKNNGQWRIAVFHNTKVQSR